MKNYYSRRRWEHRSVKELMLAEQSSDPVAIIRERARNMVAEARLQNWQGPPFNPQLLASLRGITVRESTSLFSAEAQLTPKNGQLLLEFNPDRGIGRKNFSICHEIAHTLFDDHYKMVHQRKSDPIAFDPQEEVEFLCQVAAAELLMPEKEFSDDLQKHSFNLGTLLDLVERYEASREAVARRMITLGEEASAAIFLSKRLKPTEERMIINGERKRQDIEPKMRILYSVSSDDFPVFIPADKSTPDDSCTYLVDESDAIGSAVENWNIRDAGDWHVEALGLPMVDEFSPIKPAVMALILPN